MFGFDCWTFITDNDSMSVNCRKTDMQSLVYELIKSGIDSNSDIAQELSITTGMVSKYAKTLMNEGVIKKDGQKYVISLA